MFGDEGPDVASWLTSCREVLDRYFTLEDPRRLEPAERELYVEALLDSKLLLRGFVDRLDVAPDGRIRVVDYKTGKAPGEGFEAKALFQMKFYALVVWRTRGVVPSVLQLVYLGNGEILRYEPDEADLLATERKVEAVWRAIRLAQETGDWRPSPSRLCDWCCYHRSARRRAARPRRCPRPPRLPRRTRRPTSPPTDGSGVGRAVRRPAGDAPRARRGRRCRGRRGCRRRRAASPSRIGTWLGTHSTAHPAATADLAPVLESSIARQCPGSTPSSAAAVR